jgi:TolB protein
LGTIELAIVADWDGDEDVYLIRGDGSDLSQFTNNPGEDVNPTWSKDGQQLALVIDALTDPRLYISAADGSEGRVVAPDLEVTTLHVELSPTGDLVAFRNLEDLYVVNTLTGEETLLTPGTDINPSNPRFSPAGTTLVFKADAPSGNDGLFVVNVDGSGLRELKTALEDMNAPSWHPTGDEILFEGRIPSEGVGLYVASLDGTIEKLPIVPIYGPAGAAWSPDGSMIGYIVHFSVLGSSGEIVQKNSLHVATADGNVDVELVKPPDEPDGGLRIHEIAWAPDGRHIAYTTVSEGRTDLFVLDICNGTSSLVVQGVDFFSTPSWRPTP